jgi:hypothetical protein
MKNRVRVSATFSFRGETLRPEMVLDLDRMPLENLDAATLYPMLAAANGIDPYSYEYEVLEVTPLEFDRPEGLVGDFLENGQLDLEGLRQALATQALETRLQEIAKSHLGIDDLDEMPGLKSALMAAWRAGRQG